TYHVTVGHRDMTYRAGEASRTDNGEDTILVLPITASTASPQACIDVTTEWTWRNAADSQAWDAVYFITVTVYSARHLDGALVPVSDFGANFSPGQGRRRRMDGLWLELILSSARFHSGQRDSMVNVSANRS
ncbi:hypothetical protein BaRGS_00026354, partial [Batillaria attramentaria]